MQTKVTPIVEGYGGWAFRMEIVPIESAYPGFGELVVSLIILIPPVFTMKLQSGKQNTFLIHLLFGTCM